MPRLWPAVGILCAYLAIAAVYTHPVIPHSFDRIANDPYDPILNTSILWWNATTIPFTEIWWNPPHFYPARDVAAFTENLVGVSVIASPIFWLTANALAAYNLSFFLTWPLSAFAAYLLAFAIVRRHDAAFLAGLSFGFTPYRTAELGHLQMLSVYWIPLCLLALHRFLDTRRARWLVVFAAAWVLQALANGYFIFFGAVLIGVWILYFCTTRDGWRTMPAILAACVLANLPLVPVMLKYHVVHEAYGLRRTMAEALWFSAPVEGWFKVSSVVWLWPNVLGDSKDDLFPGITAVALVSAALWLSRWRKPVEEQPRVARWVLVILSVVAGLSAAAILVTLAMGAWRVELGGLTLRTSDLNRPLQLAVLTGVPLLLIKTRVVEAFKARGPFAFYAIATVTLAVLCCGPVLRSGDSVILDPMPYRWLMLVPGFDQLRVPSRFWMLGTLCLGIAAAIAFARVVPARGRWRPLAVALVSIGLLLDGWTNGIGMVTAPEPWARVEPRVDTLRGGHRADARPILELPLGPAWDAAATYRSMRHRRPVVNGVSGYDPPHYAPLQAGLNERDPQTLVALASLGEVDVVVDGSADSDGSWARYVAAVAGAAPVASDGSRTTYRLPRHDAVDSAVGPTLAIASVDAVRHDTQALHDGRPETEWGDEPQRPGQWIRIDLGRTREVGGVTHALGQAGRDYPRLLAIDVSIDGVAWEQVWQGPTAGLAFLAAVRTPRTIVMHLTFPPRPARYVRLRQLATHPHMWRVGELTVNAPVGKP